MVLPLGKAIEISIARCCPKKLYVMENPGLLAKYVCDTAKTEATRAYKYRQSRDSPVNRGGEALEWPFDE